MNSEIWALIDTVVLGIGIFLGLGRLVSFSIKNGKDYEANLKNLASGIIMITVSILYWIVFVFINHTLDWIIIHVFWTNWPYIIGACSVGFVLGIGIGEWVGNNPIEDEPSIFDEGQDWDDE